MAGSRSVLSRVTRAVTFTTESLGRPEAAAGTNTLPGIAAEPGHLGSRASSFGDGIDAIPVSALWGHADPIQ